MLGMEPFLFCSGVEEAMGTSRSISSWESTGPFLKEVLLWSAELSLLCLLRIILSVRHRERGRKGGRERGRGRERKREGSQQAC